MSKTVMTYNNTVMSFGSTPKWMAVESDPYNPLGLPPYTMRFQFGNLSYNPTNSLNPWNTGAQWVRVSTSPNIWDYTRENSNWREEFDSQFQTGNSGTTRLLGANFSGVTRAHGMFQWCTGLSNLVLFDTSNLTYWGAVFANSGITSIPQFPLSSAITELSYAFYRCRSVTTGALNMYNRLIATGSVVNHISTFEDCGSGNASGQAELAQIPTSWGGTMS